MSSSSQSQGTANPGNIHWGHKGTDLSEKDSRSASSDEVDLEAERPPQKTGITFGRNVTIQEDDNVGLGRSRTNNAQIPAMFRTLSIQVYDSQYYIARSKDPKKDESDSEFFARVDYHTLPVEQVYQRFNVSPSIGLDATAVNKRVERHGKNVLSKTKRNYFWKLFKYFFGGFCSILWVGVIVNFICWRPLGNPNPPAYQLAVAIAIILVIIFQALFSAFQDYSTAKVMNSILNLLPDNCIVLRDGQLVTLPASELVPGDVVHLSTGNKVPADMRIVTASSDLRLDRSVLTGESEEIPGVVLSEEPNFLEAKNMAFLGTHICNGSAVGVVCLTGAASVMGRINKLTNNTKEKSTLIQK